MPPRRTPLAAFLLALAVAACPGRAEPVPPSLCAGLRWRMIGPFRGGRTVGATGVTGRPNVFCIGVNDGGVWKGATGDSGEAVAGATCSAGTPGHRLCYVASPSIRVLSGSAPTR